MPSVHPIQNLVDQLRSGQLSLAEVRDLLRHPAALIRVNALEALVGYEQHGEEVIEELRAAVADPMNTVRLMGTVSVAHVAVACLLRIGSPNAHQAAQALLGTRPEPDRTDLLWYLKSEGLMPSG